MLVRKVTLVCVYNYIFYLVLFCGFFSTAQTMVSSKIDSTSVQIGRPIHYSISVKIDTLYAVAFPENKSFQSLKVIDSSDVDTVIKKNYYKLIRDYTLIGFDEEISSVPQLSVRVGDKIFKLDSILIEIRTIKVDTLSKQYYDVKPMVEVEVVSEFNWRPILYILLGILLILLGYLFYKHKYKIIKERKKIEKLPPFEKAKKNLYELSKEDYLNHSHYKDYYSKLINIFKYYLEEEIPLSVLENTSEELVFNLMAYIDDNRISITESDIVELRNVLYRSDMVKFAKSLPERYVVEQDTLIIKNIIGRINDTLPQSILQARIDKELDEQARRLLRRKKRIKYTIYVVLGSLIIFLSALTIKNGIRRTFDAVIGNSTLELLDGSWVVATYGFPPVELETPDVLKRRKADSLQTKNQSTGGLTHFQFGGLSHGILIALDQVVFTKEIQDEENLSQAVEGAVRKKIEAFGGQNIIIKQEDFSTRYGEDGIKNHGSFDYKSTSVEYVILTFVNEKAMIQLELLYRKGDRYADDITNRVLKSLKFKELSQ